MHLRWHEFQLTKRLVLAIYLLLVSIYVLCVLVRKDMDVNEHERLFSLTQHEYIDVNEHERLFRLTLKHKYICILM